MLEKEEGGSGGKVIHIRGSGRWQHFVCFEADKVEYEDGIYGGHGVEKREERSTYIRGKGG